MLHRTPPRRRRRDGHPGHRAVLPRGPPGRRVHASHDRRRPDTVRSIYAEGVATRNATFETEVPTGSKLRKWLPGHRGWPSSTDGRGLGRAAPVSDRDCYSGVAETSVYVTETARGRGVGKALLHRQVNEADQGGLWTLQTSIFPENRASIALHHSAGYRTLAVRPRIAKLDGIWRDTVFLERRRAD